MKTSTPTTINAPRQLSRRRRQRIASMQEEASRVMEESLSRSIQNENGESVSVMRLLTDTTIGMALAGDSRSMDRLWGMLHPETKEIPGEEAAEESNRNTGVLRVSEPLRSPEEWESERVDVEVVDADVVATKEAS